MAETILEKMKALYPDKFASEEDIFSNITRRQIFIGTACGTAVPREGPDQLCDLAPKGLLRRRGPAGLDLGVAPYTDEKFKHNFRHNSFFIGKNTRTAVNEGMADYTPISLSQVPNLLRRKFVPWTWP